MNNTEKQTLFFKDIDFILRVDTKFRLYLSICNDNSCIQEIHNKILNEYNTVRWLSFPANNNYLLSFVENNLEATSAKLLIIEGLKDNNDIGTVLASMNIIRNSFRKFELPIILWVDDNLVGKFIKLAPNFYSWCCHIYLKD